MSVLAGDDRHNLLTERVVTAPPSPQQAPRTIPPPTPPARPNVFKPTGPPIPALTSIGYWGSIHDFNAAVQAAHDGLFAANGVRPDPKTLLSTALKTPVTGGRRDQGPEQLSKLPPIGKEDNSALLDRLKAITQGPYDLSENLQRHSDFNAFMRQNSDVLQEMLNDPKTKAKTLATINEAAASLDYHGIVGPNLSFVQAMKDITTRPASWAGRSAFALSQDFFQMGGASMNDGKTLKVSKFEADRQQAATFPHLTKVAPALAQVVKGLVYSPAGIAATLEATSLDLYDAALYERSSGRKGSIQFKRTRKLAEGFANSFWQDMTHPGGRAGYLLLDTFGLVSLGVGGAARLGRAGEAFSEASRAADARTPRISPEIQKRAVAGDQYARDYITSQGLDWRSSLSDFSGPTRDIRAGLKAGGKAFMRQHDLNTVEYNKGGFTENVSLPTSPFSAMIARKIPFIGTDAQVAQLLDPMHDPFSWIRTAKLGDDDAYGRGATGDKLADILTAVSNPLSPESRMGRAGSISRATEAKVMSANLRQVEDVAGWSVRKSWLDSIVPDSWFEGLTKGEDKALQIAALDYPGSLGDKIAAWETTHQFLIESGIGDREAHLQQLAELHLARKSVENPTARFTHALEVLRDTSTKAEQLRIAWGMPAEAAQTGILKPGLFVQYANEAADLLDQMKENFKVQPLAPGEEMVYHGSQSHFDTYDVNRIRLSQYGRGVYVSSEPKQANIYAEGRLEPRAAGYDENSVAYTQGNIRLHRLDTSRLFDTRNQDWGGYIADAKKRLLPHIPKEVRPYLEDKNDPTARDLWVGGTDGQHIIEGLNLAFNMAIQDGKFKIPEDIEKSLESGVPLHEGMELARRVFEKAGYAGYKSSPHERFIFNPNETLTSPWGEVPGQKAMELRLHNLKSFMGNLDVRYVPEGYTVPEFVPSTKLALKMKDLESKKKTLQKTESAEKEWIDTQKAKIAAAVKGKGREFSLDSKYRDTIVSLSEVVDALQKEVDLRTTREQKVHAGRHPAEGLPEGYYAKIGGTFVPVNRQSEDSFYVPTLLRGGRNPSIPRGNVRLPGSVYGIGPASAPIWNDYQMSGRALMDGDFRTDTPHLVGQSYAATARAIPRFKLFNEAWSAAREVDENHPLGDYEIYVRDIEEVSTEIRKAFQSLREGHITQEEVEGIPADLMEHLYPRNPKPGEHVRAIDQRMLGDAFFGAKTRQMAAAEPAVRMIMSPINNTLRPLILYLSPKYALNIIGNGGMLVFDEGFVRSYQNLSLAFTMDDWALEDDRVVFLNGMGAGKASSYMSGEVGSKLGRISQGLADFWSKASDQNFRLASGLFYAKRVINAAPEKFAGETFPEKFHDLLSNPDHEVVRDDVMKRGNDALVAFDRMSPVEKAWLRHIIFVYPWQRGALLWSFRAVFEHPAKAAILATLGQEAYTDDTWLKSAPEWVRTTGYVPYHWTGDSVMVQNFTSMNTFSTLNDVVSTTKGLIEGDQYARVSDLFGPAGQLIIHAATGVDSYGNPYKGSQLLGAIEDMMNMLPAVSSYKRAAKGAGKEARGYDVTKRTGLSSILTSAAKVIALSPGWLGGWGNWVGGGTSPRELNLTAVAARYWVNAPPKLRHQHEVDLIMRQTALQAFFLKTGKMPDGKVVSSMLLAPLGSIQIKGQIPEDVRQGILDAGQISYLSQLKSVKLGKALNDKDQLLVALKYYRDAGRLPKDEYAGQVASAMKLDNTPDIKAKIGQVALKYGHGRALYLWDRHVRIQASFTDDQTGVANVHQRLGVLFGAGLASKARYGLTTDERGQYGHKYVEYLTKREELKASLQADKTLTGTQRSLKLTEFDSKHDAPVKIGTHMLPSVTALGSGANWDGPSADTAGSQKRLALLATKNWYHLNSAEKSIFGQKADPSTSEGWTHYWKALREYRDSGNSVDSSIREQAAQYVTQNFAKGFMRDWKYATTTPKINRFEQSKIYQSMPERAAFDQVAASAKVAAKAMADGTSTITQTRHDWKAYVNNSLMPWIEKDHPKLYAWLQPLGPSFLTSMINTG